MLSCSVGLTSCCLVCLTKSLGVLSVHDTLQLCGLIKWLPTEHLRLQPVNIEGLVRATLRRGHTHTEILQDSGKLNKCDKLCH